MGQAGGGEDGFRRMELILLRYRFSLSLFIFIYLLYFIFLNVTRGLTWMCCLSGIKITKLLQVNQIRHGFQDNDTGQPMKSIVSSLIFIISSAGLLSSVSDFKAATVPS